MTKQPAPHSGEAAASSVTHQEPSGWLSRQFEDMREFREALKRNPLLVSGLVLGLFVCGAFIDAVKDRVMAKILPPDEFLAQMSEDQKHQFEDLKKNLGDIQSSIKGEDRAAFSGVKDAVAGIEKTNTDLIQQLLLAKQENETLRKVAQQKTGISGGYDFILSEGTGMRLDSQTSLGVQRISSGYVQANLSSRAAASVTQSLQSGQSIAYQNASGQACKVTLLSVNDAGPGSASFALGCT